MTEDPQPLVAIALRDGRTLQVAADGVHIEDSFYELARIQDARQVAPDPATVALRVAGAGVVEFQPAQASDGALALEALYRLRPDLRPAGAEPPSTVPPNWPTGLPPRPAAPGPWPAPGAPPYAFPGGYPPPPAGYPAYPGYTGYPPYPPVMPPPGGYAPPAGFGPPPGRPPGDSGGRLTPFPRDIGGVLGAIFELFFGQWLRWIALGLCVALLPAVLIGSLTVGEYLLFGANPWGSSLFAFQIDPQNSGAFPLHFPSMDELILFGGITLGVLVLAAVFGAWQVATLASGARDIMLGRGLSIGRSLRDGLRGLLRVLATNILYGMFLLAAAIPAVLTAAVALGIFASALAMFDPTSTDPSASQGVVQELNAAVLLLLLAGLLYLVCLVLIVFLSTRLGLAPYIAATERMGPVSALAKSWRLTRRNFWRTLIPQFVIGLIVGFIGYIGGMVQYASVAAAVLVVVPLLTACLAPLTVLAASTVLYDLRLRREGYAAIVQDQPLATPPGPAQGTPAAP